MALLAENSSVCTKSRAGHAQGMAETAAKITEQRSYQLIATKINLLCKATVEVKSQGQ